MDRTSKEVSLNDDLKAALLSLAKDIDKEDEEAYDEVVRVCAELEHYWKGNHYLFWDGSLYYTARQMAELVTDAGITQQDIDEFERVVNIYKAHGESIIAALAMEVPNVAFYPADAKNPTDISTAQTYTKLSRIVAQENRAPLLLIRALYTMFNGGLIAGYNYHERSEKYGFIEVEEVETQRVETPIYACGFCGAPIETPDPQMCPQCQQPTVPIVSETIEEDIPLRSEIKQYPKGKEKLKVYGPPFVKLPMTVQSQDECGYIRLSYEISIGLARSLYKVSIPKSNSDDDFARQQRLSLVYGGLEPTNLCTVKLYWIRPWYFYNLDDQDKSTALENKFKNGAFIIVINNQVVRAYEETLDDHWTISENPLYTYIYGDPIGKSLKPIQDKRNEEDRLVTDTLRHGIPFTLADSEALDFERFKQNPARPGDIFPAKAPFGKALQDGFHTLKTATVPQEITVIADRTDKSGQFVVGSFPSIYGGPSEGGSRTYAEYASSRQQALQRLSVLWKTIVDWWVRMMERAVTSRAKNLDEDEVFTEKVADDFLSVWVRKSELDGKIGRVISESSERLPMSWLQKKDQMMELMNLKLPEINSAIFHPENANLLALLFGFPELTIPGSDQRLKQLSEIKELSETEPMMPEVGMNQMGPMEQEQDPMAQQQQQPQSTVAVEDGVDDHMIHSEVCQAYLVSEAGQLLRKTNPGGYQNVLLHKQEHDMIVQQQQMQQQMMQAQMQAQNAPPENGESKTENNNG